MVDCKTCEFQFFCTMPDFVRNDLKRCKVYQEKKPQSNADRIRSMSDEELAEFLKGKIWCEMCGYGDKGICYSVKKDCRGGILQWLKSEVKE